MVCVGTGLERNQIVGILLHPGEPVDDELVGLPAVQAQLGQGVLQKRGGACAGDTEAPGEVVCGVRNALPVEVVVGLAALVRQGAVGPGSDGPAATIGRIGAGQLAVKVQLDGDVCFRFRIKVDDGLFRFGNGVIIRTGGQQGADSQHG